MLVQFHKMHGAGNDFVLLDHRQSGQDLDPGLAAHLANRQHGVGCDQVLVLKSSNAEGCTARYEVFNADGSRAGQCGNGVRCIALYLQRRGEFGTRDEKGNRQASPSLELEGPAGIVTVSLCADGEFECAMGEPRFEPGELPLDQKHERLRRESDHFVLEVGGEEVRIGTVSMGNPHAVMVVEDVDSAPVAGLGPKISRHPAFPEGCNAGFAQIVDADNIRLRVFERGTGETLACGSGACAAVAVLAREQRLSAAVNVVLPGGHLVIKWDGPGSEMTMKGPAAHVFRGTLDE